MRSTLLLSFVLGARLVAANTKYLLPLYQWPNDDGTCWPELTSVASAHPDLDWIIIINPDSGPSKISDIQPVLDCIPRLRSAIPSAQLVGYVSTRYGDRAQSEVEADIDTYATWKTAKTTDGKTVGLLDGLFADEMSYDGSDVSLYATYAERARAKLGDLVVMNPGTKVDDSYYDAASLIVSYEYSYEDWSPSSLYSSAEAPFSKQAIMLHNLPVGDSSTVGSILDTLVTKNKVAAVWLSDFTLDVNIYGSLSDNFAGVISALDSRNKALPSSNATSKPASTSSSSPSTTSAARTTTSARTTTTTASTTKASTTKAVSTTKSSKQTKTRSWRKPRATKRVHHH